MVIRGFGYLRYVLGLPRCGRGIYCSAGAECRVGGAMWEGFITIINRYPNHKPLLHLVINPSYSTLPLPLDTRLAAATIRTWV